ncbi:T9SS type A sorting domain-containing protein [Flavivirga aquimarina]|uniref:T9SS type A sorting domain-containing protein n=1 Tax=Flavivirga aquimarina TaxID=2027862 RepID=A0ABT8WGR8_9FLAO|nr:T9SS type A sorting domain-containing protein [Flavivirga aquimarina]MDO5972349.1 T9SS type A sorting domain-containing protein [Flavivirga aquimarina]
MKKNLLIALFFNIVAFLNAQDWKLSDGYFIPAKMPMHLVYPQPDNITQTHSRHRWAHSNMEYEIPIGVQGGAWPFKYEIVQGPTGATIGEIYGSENYGNISWLAPNSGVYHFEIKITDQEYNTVTAEWDVTIDDSKFVFIQDGYTGTKVGTISQPLEDIEDWYKNDRNDATYHNKIIVFRAGNYLVKGDSSANDNLRLDANTKTPSLIGYPDEIPVLDCSSAKIFTDNGSLKDVFVAGIKWIDGRQDVNNAHFWWATGDVSRSTWWKNHFHNLGPGIVGTDNTLAVFVSATGSYKENILYKENNHTEIHNQGNNGGFFEAYWSDYVLVEQNIASDSGVASGWFLKGTRSFTTVRANVAINNVSGCLIKVGYGAEVGSSAPHDHEVCYNHIKVSETQGNSELFLFASSNYYENTTYNSYVYRNTFVGGSSWIRFKGNENYTIDGNVIISGLQSRWNTTIMTTGISDLTGSINDDIVDDNGLLTGDFRTDHLGIRGHEILMNTNLHVDDNDDEFKTSISIYPNPFLENISIDLGKSFATAHIKVHGIDGKLIKEDNFKEISVIPLTINAAAGIYFITINTKSKAATFKIVKR